MNIRRLYTYSKEIYSWAIEPQLAFLCFSILILAVLTSFYTWPSERTIRISGYVLQFLGMLFAIRGILKIRAYFGHPTLKILLIAWIQRFPKWKRDIIISAGDVKIGTIGLDARIEIWAPDIPNDVLEKRLEAVLLNLNSLREMQSTLAGQIKKIEKNHKSLKESQKQELEKIEKRVNSEIETLHTKDILISLIGLVWLTFGITMSTLSIEISSIFQ
jgi:hypothetical protein